MRSFVHLSYAEYVTKNVLQPLGLTSTTPEMPEAEKGKRRATGYGKFGRNPTRAPLAFFQARGIAPAAGYASTARDLARFASWQFKNLATNGKTVLAANTLGHVRGDVRRRDRDPAVGRFDRLVVAAER